MQTWRSGRRLAYGIGAVVAWTLSGLGACVWAATLERGATWYATGFQEADALGGWTGRAELVREGDTNRSVAVTATETTRGALITRPLSAASVRGCVVRGKFKVRAEGVTAKPNSWNGIKCMLVIETPNGKDYPQAPLPTGTFGWQQTRFTTRIPVEATNVVLVLGLEQVSGKAWFDDLEFTVVREPRPRPGAMPGPRYKGHSLPRLRGTMISPSINERSLRVLGTEWNANLIRWQLIRTGRSAQEDSTEAYDRWIEGELRKLDAALPICEKLGIYVVVDLHSPPGGRPTAGGYAGSDHGLFTDRRCQERFVELWRSIALRYKASNCIWGYDLANEPVEGDVADDCADWQDWPSAPRGQFGRWTRSGRS